MSYKTGFYKGRLGIGLDSSMGMGNGNPRYPLDINGDIRLTGDIINENGFSLLGNAVNGTFIISDASNVILSNVNANVGIGTTNPISKLSVYQGGITLDNPVATYTNASVAATANSLKPFEIRATAGSLAEPSSCTILLAVVPTSTFNVAEPDVAPPVKPVPATTAVMSPAPPPDCATQA